MALWSRKKEPAHDLQCLSEQHSYYILARDQLQTGENQDSVNLPVEPEIGKTSIEVNAQPDPHVQVAGKFLNNENPRPRPISPSIYSESQVWKSA
jgi:hypothetical protein